MNGYEVAQVHTNVENQVVGNWTVLHVGKNQ
jgi:hypothetical protein